MHEKESGELAPQNTPGTHYSWVNWWGLEPAISTLTVKCFNHLANQLHTHTHTHTSSFFHAAVKWLHSWESKGCYDLVTEFHQLCTARQLATEPLVACTALYSSSLLAHWFLSLFNGLTSLHVPSLLNLLPQTSHSTMVEELHVGERYQHPLLMPPGMCHTMLPWLCGHSAPCFTPTFKHHLLSCDGIVNAVPLL